jgi:nitrous oxidase accessory protein NosD
MRNAVKCALAMTAGSAITLALTLAPEAASADTAGGETFFVSPEAPSGDGTSCATAIYWNLRDAMDDAADGDTVIVCPGTYYESVTVDKRITLRGLPGAVIDASGPVGIRVVADGATIKGLTVIVHNS